MCIRDRRKPCGTRVGERPPWANPGSRLAAEIAACRQPSTIWRSGRDYPCSPEAQSLASVQS
eukprot:1674812-Alexandrium_andersonii.AAC.1